MKFFSVFFAACLFVISCSNDKPVSAAEKLPPAISDSASLVKQNGKTVTIRGKWLRTDLYDHQNRIFLDDGHYLLVGFCSLSDTLSALLMNAAEKNCLGKKIRISGRFYREYPDTCSVIARYADKLSIGYLDFIQSIEADTSNTF